MDQFVDSLVTWVFDNPLPTLVVVAVAVLLVFANSFHTTTQWRDPQRFYNAEQRAVVLKRAGGRCESRSMLGLARCRSKATQIDHVFPWSRGGPTTVENGQALCQPCNARKSNQMPSRLYIRRLERARRRYFPAGQDVRVRVAVR